jgi:hypothetical protein
MRQHRAKEEAMVNFRGGPLNRRRFVLTAAGTVGSVASLAWPQTAASAAPLASTKHDPPPPNPIPGGLQLAPALVIHVFPPGDPTVTLPFTGFTLGGFDIEPSTITDFNGSTAVAYHVGSARASDGTTYNLETDIRAFEGEYVVGGEFHHGSFALV